MEWLASFGNSSNSFLHEGKKVKKKKNPVYEQSGPVMALVTDNWLALFQTLQSANTPCCSRSVCETGLAQSTACRDADDCTTASRLLARLITGIHTTTTSLVFCRLNECLEVNSARPIAIAVTQRSAGRYSGTIQRRAVTVVAISLLARIWGECSTTHSPACAFFFFFWKWRLARAH